MLLHNHLNYPFQISSKKGHGEYLKKKNSIYSTPDKNATKRALPKLRQRKFPIHPIPPPPWVSSYGESLSSRNDIHSSLSPFSIISSHERYAIPFLYRRAKQLRIPDLLRNHRHPRKRTRDRIAVAQSNAWKKRCVRAFAPL